MHVFFLDTEKILPSRYFHAVSHWRDFAEIKFFALTLDRRQAFGSLTLFDNRCVRKYKAQRDASSASSTSSNILFLAESQHEALR